VAAAIDRREEEGSANGQRLPKRNSEVNNKTKKCLDEEKKIALSKE